MVEVGGWTWSSMYGVVANILIFYQNIQIVIKYYVLYVLTINYNLNTSDNIK